MTEDRPTRDRPSEDSRSGAHPAKNRRTGGRPSEDRTLSDRSAERLVLSYPTDLSTWGRQQVEEPSFRAYLRKVHETAAVGDVWEEFVGVGCCGNTLDVPLRVETVEGGDRLDEDTIVEYEVREACDVEGGWLVQSQSGPRA